MKKLFLIIVGLTLVYSVYTYSSEKSAKEKAELEEIMEDINGAFDRSTRQTENDTVVQVPTKKVNEVVGSGGPKKVYSKEAKEYFKEIALKTEFDGDRKNAFVWTKDMKIFVDGNCSEDLMTELRRIVSELNGIIDPIKIKIVSNKSESNYVVFFGSHTSFKSKYELPSPQRLDDNLGFFSVNTNSGVMYVDTYRANNLEQKHLLREELTQSLGLFNDSYKYPESIFYQGWTTTTEFAPIDRELIDMLYNN